MHELGLAMNVVELASRRAAGARVTHVVLELGVLTAVVPEALAFSFELAAQGTLLDGAKLTILTEPARARCRTCSVASEQTSIVAECACGARDFEWLSGTELRIREMEVI